jgi:hypothetical protein
MYYSLASRQIKAYQLWNSSTINLARVDHIDTRNVLPVSLTF